MNHRGLLLIVTVLGASTFGLTMSCSAPDPGEITFVERRPGGESSTSNGGSNSSSTGGSTSSGGSTSTSSGGSTSTSAGGEPANAFVGAAAYKPPVANAAGSQNGAHGNGGNPAGLACRDCHKAGGQAQNDVWTFGGTVYDANNQPVAGAEVRVVDKAGKAISVYSDTLGNFWTGDPTVVPFKVGVRNATLTNMMGTALDPAKEDGSCARSTCHSAASPGKIQLK